MPTHYISIDAGDIERAWQVGSHTPRKPGDHGLRCCVDDARSLLRMPAADTSAEPNLLSPRGKRPQASNDAK